MTVVGCLLVAGCSANKAGKPDDPAKAAAPPIFKTTLDLDKSKYRVGEMVRVTLNVINQTDEDLVIVPPFPRRLKTQSNADFYFSTAGVFDVRRVVPVLPEESDMKKMGNPPPEPIAGEGKLQPRDFFFTNLTSEPGKYRIQVHYTSSLYVQVAGTNIAYSPYVEFEVTGPVKYQRDKDGFLLEGDAIRVAKEAYGKLAQDGYAILVKNDKGLYDWWVTLEKMPYDVKMGDEPRVAYYVSPYGGFVRESNVKSFLKPSKFQEPEIRQAPNSPAKLRNPGGLSRPQ